MKNEKEDITQPSTTESIGSTIDSQNTDVFIKTITDEILKRVVPDEANIPAINSGLLVSQEILGDIMKGADYNIERKESYEEKIIAHNQHGLFNLKEVVTNFEMNDKIYCQLTFRESLLISKLEPVFDEATEEYYYVPQPVGGICIDVQEAEGKQPEKREMENYENKLIKLLDEEGIVNHIAGGEDVSSQSTIDEDDLEKQNQYGVKKFLIHVSSQFDVDGNNGGSSMTSWVDRNFHTIEELRKEFLMEDDGNVNEKSLYTAMKKKWYYIKHTSSMESFESKKLYSIRKAQDYISEGANFILMRYLAIRRYFGRFQLACCYINGDMCKNTYECYGPTSEEFQGQRVDCCRIKRTIVEECGIIHKCITVMTLQGRILKQEWDDSDYVLIINPHVKLTNTKPTCQDELNLDNTWVDDIQLLSNYLDHKHKCLLDMKTYDLDHPELRHLIADYVNQIVLMRPSDIKTFTYKYFGSFVSTQLPRSEYYE